MSKMGRPRDKSEEDLKQIGDDLVDFFTDNEDKYFITSFCVHIGTYKQKMSEWSKQSKYFAEQLKKAKVICEDRIANLMFEGKQPTGAIFALKCQHDWRDVVVTENKTTLTGSFADTIKKISEDAK